MRLDYTTIKLIMETNQGVKHENEEKLHLDLIKSDEAIEDALENGPMRVLGYAGRIGRLAGSFLGKGSRYIAYSSDVGESFRPVVDRKWVTGGYVVAAAYVAADVGITSHTAYVEGNDVKREASQRFTFQVLGSLLLPSIAIHQAVHFSQKKLATAASANLKKWGPVCVGLGKHFVLFLDDFVTYFRLF